MILAERETEIIRIQSQDSPPELLAALEATLKREVMMVTKSTIEATLVEELEADRQSQTGPQPRRSGYFSRILDTEYGRIERFQVPKLRWGNKEREWQILRRPGRGLDSLLNFTLSLYVMGLSLRDLQEALYPILGSVLSVNAINRITLEAQARLALFVEKWDGIEPKAVSTFERDISLTFNFYHFAAELHPRIRTSNRPLA